MNVFLELSGSSKFAKLFHNIENSRTVVTFYVSKCIFYVTLF